MKNQINIFLTPKQFLAEKTHLGAGFNSDNYLLINDNKNVNEGIGGFIVSLPAIIKLFRMGVEKGQEAWIKKFNADFYDKIDKRSFIVRFFCLPTKYITL